MKYNELIQKVKGLFMERLQKIVNDDAYKANFQLTKNAYLDVLYSEIMALGYNFGDVDKATNDIYEIQSILNGESQELRTNIKNGVIETSTIYPLEVSIFSDFHKSYQSNTSENELIENLIEKLNK